jgi:O-antigen/teichoic acid export membrane protein
LLLYSPSYANLVRWAALSGAAGALWRLTVNVFRMERQPSRFAAFNALRPLFVICGSVPLVALGFGVEGALAGTALGTLLASGVCVAMSRRSYALAFSFSDAREIVRRGALVVVPVLCLFAVHNGDVVLLSRFASTHEVGIYRVASRFAALPSYFASAFLMAWAPLERGVLFKAAYRHAGEQRVRGALLNYYLLAGMTLVVLLDVTSRLLVLLAGPDYRAAAPLIPLIGVGFVGYGLFVVLVRVVKIESLGQRMAWYSLGGLLACGLFVGLSTITIPWLGAYGVPVAMISATLAACLMWIVAVKLFMKLSFGFNTRPLVGLGGAVTIAAAVQLIGLSLWPTGRPFVLLLVLASYVALVFGFGVVPRHHMRPLLQLARAATRGGLSGQNPTVGLRLLTPERRDLLAAIERDNVPIAVLAERLGRSAREVRCEYVASLRDLVSVESDSSELDERIASYLLSRQPEAQRDLGGHELVEDGVDALDLLQLDEAARRLRALSHQAWSAHSRTTPSHEYRVDLGSLKGHLASLPLAQRHAAIAILRDGRTPAQVAAETGMHEHLVAARVVRVLRCVGRLDRGGPDDAAIGMALFGGGSPQVGAVDSQALRLTYDRVRRHSHRQWRRKLPTAMRESAIAAPAGTHSNARENGAGSPEMAFGRVAPTW